MMTEVEKKNREGLLKLMQENPDLPVIPMVRMSDSNCSCWLGSLGNAYIGEYISSVDYDCCASEKIFFKKDCNSNVKAFMYFCFHGEEKLIDPSDENRGVMFFCFCNNADFGDISDDELRAMFDALPWKKAIIVEADELMFTNRVCFDYREDD